MSCLYIRGASEVRFCEADRQSEPSVHCEVGEFPGIKFENRQISQTRESFIRSSSKIDPAALLCDCKQTEALKDVFLDGIEAIIRSASVA